MDPVFANVDSNNEQWKTEYLLWVWNESNIS